MQFRIGLACAAFAKLNSILRSLKPKLNYEIRFFKAAYISILLYGCQTWILTRVWTEKHDIFASKLYRIMLVIKQSRYHVTTHNKPRNASWAATQFHKSVYTYAYRWTCQPLCNIRSKSKIISSTRSTRSDLSTSNFVSPSNWRESATSHRVKKDGIEKTLHRTNILSCLIRKCLRTNYLSSNDDDEILKNFRY